MDWNLMNILIMLISTSYLLLNCASKKSDKSTRGVLNKSKGMQKPTNNTLNKKKSVMETVKKTEKTEKEAEKEKSTSKEKEDLPEKDENNKKKEKEKEKDHSDEEENNNNKIVKKKSSENKNSDEEAKLLKKVSNEKVVKLEKKGSGSDSAEHNDVAPAAAKTVEKSKKKENDREKDKDDKKEECSDNRKTWAQRVSKMKCVVLSKVHKEKLKGYMAPKCTYKVCEKNNNLNRYTDVMCIDETRVVLKNRENDYIHASYMQMPDKKTTYILTQGPLPETISDFWAMIVQEKVKIVIMLCPLMEGGVEKCASYYPTEKGQKEVYGGFEITFEEKKEEPVEGVFWSVLHVVDKENPHSEPYVLNHVFVPWWPDQLAPDDPKPVIKLYKWMKKLNPEGSPICVHCSAGVGRTATFVGIDYANLRIQENPNIELVEIVREMRSMRFQAVQTHMQFLFLHVCLLEYFCQEGIVERDGSIQNTMEMYQKHAGKKLAKRVKDNNEKKNKSIEEP